MDMKFYLLFQFVAVNHISACMQNANEFERPPNLRQAYMIEVVDDTLPKGEETLVIDNFSTKCSVKCGEGVQTIRRVDCKASCFPDCCVRKVEEIPCFSDEDCHATFGLWSSWSSCSLPCVRSENEKSLKHRKRKCVDHCYEKTYGKKVVFAI